MISSWGYSGFLTTGQTGQKGCVMGMIATDHFVGRISAGRGEILLALGNGLDDDESEGEPEPIVRPAEVASDRSRSLIPDVAPVEGTGAALPPQPAVAAPDQVAVAPVRRARRG